MSRHIFGMSILLSMATLHLLGHSDQSKVKHDSVYVMPLAPVLASHGANDIWKGYHICYDKTTERRWCYVMPLAVTSVSHDADGIIGWYHFHSLPVLASHGTNGIEKDILSLRTEQLKQGDVMLCHWHWHQCLMMLVAHQWHSIPFVKMIEMSCNMTFMIMSCHWHWC